MRVVSKAEFSREAGVTASAISKALNTILKETLSNGGIDADHPAAIRYLSRCGHVGRPQGSEKVELADFVVSRFSELNGLNGLVPEIASPLVKSIDRNLFYIGFAEKWCTRKELSDRMVFVERGLDQLRSMVRNKNTNRQR